MLNFFKSLYRFILLVLLITVAVIANSAFAEVVIVDQNLSSDKGRTQACVNDENAVYYSALDDAFSYLKGVYKPHAVHRIKICPGVYQKQSINIDESYVFSQLIIEGVSKQIADVVIVGDDASAVFDLSRADIAIHDLSIKNAQHAVLIQPGAKHAQLRNIAISEIKQDAIVIAAPYVFFDQLMIKNIGSDANQARAIVASKEAYHAWLSDVSIDAVTSDCVLWQGADVKLENINISHCANRGLIYSARPNNIKAQLKKHNNKAYSGGWDGIARHK